VATITTIVDDGLPSIQGEYEQVTVDAMFASDEDVAAYVETASPGVRACRERGRHLFAPTQVTGMVFVGVDEAGLLIRRVDCDSCGMVERVELWDVRHHRGKVTRAVLVSAKPAYKDPAYLNKAGKGRMTPKQVRNALATIELGGLDFRQLLKAARSAGKEEAAHGPDSS
jgi:hypothetical protein